MNQLAFAFPPLSRTHDPQTSHDAAKKADKFKAKHEDRIFNALYEASAQNLTYRQIAEVTGMDGDYETRNGMCVWRVA